MIPSNIVSQKLGPLLPDIDPDDDDETPMGLTAIYNFTSEGSIAVNLPDIENSKTKKEWVLTVAKLDQDFDVLIGRIRKLRSGVISEVAKLYRELTGKESIGDATVYFKLKHINYRGDGTIGVWYSGDQNVHFRDLNIDLDKEWRTVDIRFDG